MLAAHCRPAGASWRPLAGSLRTNGSNRYAAVARSLPDPSERPESPDCKLNLPKVLPPESVGYVPETDAEPGPTPSPPPGLEGLRLDDNGSLVEEKTGKALNALGATRFDVAVRAMRGEMTRHLDPGEDREDATSGKIAESLVRSMLMWGR